MPSREAQTLRLRLLERQSRLECAALYGVSGPLFDVLLYRAAVDYQAAVLGAPQPQPLPLAALTAAAEGLRAALDGGAPAPLATALLDLQAARADVILLLEQAEHDEQRSPARRRENLLRRVGIVVVVILTAWFYLQQRDREPHKAKFEPRPPPAPTQPR